MSHPTCIDAARIWAQNHAGALHDPVKLGVDVASVYLACEAAMHHAGDEKATTAAIAALSIRPEVLQLIGQLSALGLPPSAGGTHQTRSAGAEG